MEFDLLLVDFGGGLHVGFGGNLNKGALGWWVHYRTLAIGVWKSVRH